MTNPTDSSRSIDSGVSGNAKTGAKEIRHLAERATDAGEWSAQIGAELAKRTIISGEGIVQGELIATNVYPRDAEYIVAVQPKNILKLLSECSRLASMVEELEKVLRRIAALDTMPDRLEAKKQMAELAKTALAGDTLLQVCKHGTKGRDCDLCDECPECCTQSGKTEYGVCTNKFHKGAGAPAEEKG